MPDVAQGIMAWLLIGAFWLFVLWALFATVAAVQGMRKEISRVADQLEQLSEALRTSRVIE